jgi:hypothetical protein
VKGDMTKYSAGGRWGLDSTVAADTPPAPVLREGVTCDLYEPGHQIHYRHQGEALRSPSRGTLRALVDETRVTLILDDGEELHWRHHDPERVGRILELLGGKCVVYPEHHAIRVGPYFFNCATQADPWSDCRTVTSERP